MDCSSDERAGHLCIAGVCGAVAAGKLSDCAFIGGICSDDRAAVSWKKRAAAVVWQGSLAAADRILREYDAAQAMRQAVRVQCR